VKGSFTVLEPVIGTNFFDQPLQFDINELFPLTIFNCTLLKKNVLIVQRVLIESSWLYTWRLTD